MKSSDYKTVQKLWLTVVWIMHQKHNPPLLLLRGNSQNLRGAKFFTVLVRAHGMRYVCWDQVIAQEPTDNKTEALHWGGHKHGGLLDPLLLEGG